MGAQGTGAVSYRLLLVEPDEIVIQPEVTLEKKPSSHLVKAAVAFGGKAYEVLFSVKPPQVVMVTYKGAPVDNRLNSVQHLLSFLRSSAEKLANQLLTGNVEGVPDGSMEEEAVSEGEEAAGEDP